MVLYLIVIVQSEVGCHGKVQAAAAVWCDLDSCGGPRQLPSCGPAATPQLASSAASTPRILTKSPTDPILIHFLKIFCGKNIFGN